MNISDIFFAAAAKFPDRVAIQEGNKAVSYRELEYQVRRTAGYFQSRGIEKGDRVLVFVPMSIDLYRILLAIFYSGATAVFLDEWVNFKRLNLCCKIADCKGIVSIRKVRIFSILSAGLRGIPVKLSPQFMGLEGLRMEMRPDDTALISFTTGSTGIPKAAKRTHGFLSEQFRVLIEEIKPMPEDIGITMLPVVLFINLGTGTTSLIYDWNIKNPDKINSGKLLLNLIENKASRIIASPFFINKIAREIVESGKIPPGINSIITGGAPVFPDDARLFLLAFPNADIRIAYGSTEAEPISTITASELAGSELNKLRGLPVGEINQNIQCGIIGISPVPIKAESTVMFKSLLLEEGEIGEIIVTGPHVLKEYFNNPQAWAENKIDVEGVIWHRTGDSGYFEKGKLFLTGRCSQLIFRNENIISPFLIENKVKGPPYNVRAGTLLEVSSRLVLVLEGRIIEPSFMRSDEIPFDRIEWVKRIPMDPRHHSKIDYAALRRIVEKRLK